MPTNSDVSLISWDRLRAAYGCSSLSECEKTMDAAWRRHTLGMVGITLGPGTGDRVEVRLNY